MLRGKGLTKRMAAIVAQKQTGQALQTGKPIKKYANIKRKQK
jgi:hypothetical protein